MKLARFFLVSTACALFASCGGDPFTPDGPYVASSYHASLQSVSGTFTSVCGSGAADLYAVGPVILHYDGARWTHLEPPPGMASRLTRARGFATGELLVCDGRDISMRKDGSWTALPQPPMYFDDVCGNAPDDLYVMGWDGMAHYDGSSWTDLSVPQPYDLGAMSQTGSGVVVVGRYGRLDHYDGNQWTTSNLDSTAAYQSVAVTPSGRTFVSDWTAAWEIVDSLPVLILNEGTIEGTMLRTDNEVLYAAGRAWNNGNSHVVGRYTNGAWSGVTEGEGYFHDLWAGRGEVVGVGENALLWQGGLAGGETLSLYPARGEFQDAVNIDDAIYTIGTGSFRYQNDEWADLNKEYVTRQPAYGIHGRSADDIYAVGDQMILHYDGTAWSWVNGGLGHRLQAVWVEPNGNVVAVGTDGDNPAMAEFDGVNWSSRRVPLNAYSFYDVCGVGEMVVAVGSGGLVGMRRSGHWYLLRAANATLTSVWGFDESHIYATSRNDNTIYFFDGYRWDSMAIDGVQLQDMRSIWGTSPSNFFVLDDGGTLAHFNGATWTAEERIFMERMFAVCGNSRDVLTLGNYGSAIYRR